ACQTGVPARRARPACQSAAGRAHPRPFTQVGAVRRAMRGYTRRPPTGGGGRRAWPRPKAGAQRPTQRLSAPEAVTRYTRQAPTRAISTDWVRRCEIGAGWPSIVSQGPTNITPWWRIVVPTRPSVTCSFQASAVWTPWLTAEKLDEHGNTPRCPPTAATAAVS